MDTDFVPRFFGPRVGMPEDPMTGSLHCSLIPCSAKWLDKTTPGLPAEWLRIALRALTLMWPRSRNG